MREENYFEIKLKTSKETLSNAKSRLDSLDIKMDLLEIRFEHDKKIYNDRVDHEQKIVANMEKRIPDLEKKLAQGYTTIDMRTGKAYKSFTERHKVMLKDKIKSTEEQQKIVAEKYAQRQILKKKKRSRLTPKELDAIAAQEVREEAQPEDELKEIQEKEIARLKAKEEAYRTKLAELESLKKELAIREKKGKPKDPEYPEEEIEAEIQEKINQEEIRQIETEPKEEHEGKAQCPECKEWFTKGGAFAAHYKSHFNGD